MRLAPALRATAVCATLAACGDSTAPRVPALPSFVYDEGAPAAPAPFVWSSASDAYLTTMRTRYPLETVAPGPSDMERIRAVSRWVHTRFRHDGSHVAQPGDPISILEKAATGERFRCVEYSAVTAGALTSLGIPARMTWVLLRDEATRRDGLSHVVAEAYVRELGRWVMVDAQWDAVPSVGGVPVSALELQRALARGDQSISVASASGTGTREYLAWIAPYLYYFYTRLDARIGVERAPGALLLSPVGDRTLAAKYPAPTQITSSVALFYQAP